MIIIIWNQYNMKSKTMSIRVIRRHEPKIMAVFFNQNVMKQKTMCVLSSNAFTIRPNLITDFPENPAGNPLEVINWTK